jgi:hypothetical protein
MIFENLFFGGVALLFFIYFWKFISPNAQFLKKTPKGELKEYNPDKDTADD